MLFKILTVMLAAFQNILQNIQFHQLSGCGGVFGTSTKQSGKTRSWLSLSIHCCSCVWLPIFWRVSVYISCRDACVNVTGIGKYVIKINVACHTLSIPTLRWWKSRCKRTWNTGRSLFHWKGRWSMVLINCWGKWFKWWDIEWLLSRTVLRYSAGQK